MRNLFLALVLANLAFAAWRLWFADPDTPVSRAVSEAPTITLIDELEEAGGDDVNAETCISIGTFAERTQADAAVASLRALGLEAALAAPADAANPQADADSAAPADSADRDAPFWIDVVTDLSELPETGLLQPLGLGLEPPPGEDATDTPAPATSLTLRACDSATD